RRAVHERRARPLHHRGRVRRRVLLSRGHGRPAALPRHPDPAARAHQGGQPRPRPGGARPLAAGGRSGWRAQAGVRLAARPAGQRRGVPADRARRAKRGPGNMTTWDGFDIVLAILVLPLAVWTIAARETFVAVVSYVAYGLLLALIWVRLGAPDVALAVAAVASGLRGVVALGHAGRRGGDRQRPQRRAAPRHRGQAARRRGAGGGGTAQPAAARDRRSPLGDGGGRARRRPAVPHRSCADARPRRGYQPGGDRRRQPG